MNKYQEYEKMLFYTYDQSVEYLLQKYGPAQDNYYRETSYNRFLNGEIKKISKGKTSRTKEGLYCHHIDENKALKLSNEQFIKEQNVPYEYQEKDRLVYCDLIEHCILHALIAKETDMKFGLPGYKVFLKPNIEDWYIKKDRFPPNGWRANCYNKAYLEPQKAVDIIRGMQRLLDADYYETVEDFNDKINCFSEYQKQLLEIKRERRKEDLTNMIPSAKTLHENSSRASILVSYYNIVYLEDDNNLMHKSYKEYELEMKQYRKDELLEEVLSHIENIDVADGSLDE